MGDNMNPKVVGATIIGFALVAGAYTVSRFGEPRISSPSDNQIASVQNSTPPQRVVIAVADSDENGIEDWRDAFLTTEITYVEQAPATVYKPPSTITGKTGISLLEGLLNSKLYAPLAPSSDQVAANVVSSLEKEVEIKLFETADIDIMEEWDDVDIKNYANTLAATIYRNSIKDVGNEMLIINEVVRNVKKDQGIKKLEILRDVYKGYRDDSLLIPVPKEFSKAHLDLINTYQAIYEDLAGMAKIDDDPLMTMLHLKRYQGDAQGLVIALQNMFDAIVVHSDLFGPEDPALLFVTFSPDFKLNN